MTNTKDYKKAELNWKEKYVLKKIKKQAKKYIKKAQKEGRNIFKEREEAEKAILDMNENVLIIKLQEEAEGKHKGKEINKENIKDLTNEELDNLLKQVVTIAEKYV